MTIVIGAVQKDYSIMVADRQTCVITNKQKGSGHVEYERKSYYPHKIEVLGDGETATLVGFAGYIDFWNFFLRDVCKEKTPTIRVLKAECARVQKKYCKKEKQDAIKKNKNNTLQKNDNEDNKGNDYNNDNNGYVNNFNLLFQTNTNGFAIHSFSTKGMFEHFDYYAIGSGAYFALDIFKRLAPKREWGKFTLCESLTAVLSAYECAIQKDVGCSGAPMIYIQNEKGCTKVSYASSVLTQRLVVGYHAGIITSSVLETALPTLLNNTSTASDVSMEQIVMASPTIKREKVWELLCGLYEVKPFADRLFE